MWNKVVVVASGRPSLCPVFPNTLSESNSGRTKKAQNKDNLKATTENLKAGKGCPADRTLLQSISETRRICVVIRGGVAPEKLAVFHCKMYPSCFWYVCFN